MSFEQTIVPAASDLADLGIDVVEGDSPWESACTIEWNGADTVRLTWDTISRSASIVWSARGHRVAAFSRESVRSVAVSAPGAEVVIVIESLRDSLRSVLEVAIGDAVRIDDSLLIV
jgi:hypothetical protein